MMQWNLSPFSVSPAASLLARCVSRGSLSQEEIDSASSRLSPAFSSHLHKAEERIRTQRHLNQLQLQTELLKMDQESSDVSHPLFLARKFQMLEMLCGHLQDVLRDQNRMKLRLMKPLGRTELPLQAHLHRYMVDLVKLLLDFIETLEEKLNSVYSWTRTRDLLAQLDSSLAQLLAQGAELQTLSNQVLQWREVSSSLQSDRSATETMSDQ